jgi:hypothetical protein
VNDHREKPTSYSDEFITLESRLASHLNLSDTQVNQEAYRHNGSSFKEKEEDREVHQVKFYLYIPLESCQLLTFVTSVNPFTNILQFCLLWLLFHLIRSFQWKILTFP